MYSGALHTFVTGVLTINCNCIWEGGHYCKYVPHTACMVEESWPKGVTLLWIHKYIIFEESENISGKLATSPAINPRIVDNVFYKTQQTWQHFPERQALMTTFSKHVHQWMERHSLYFRSLPHRLFCEQYDFCVEGGEIWTMCFHWHYHIFRAIVVTLLVFLGIVVMFAGSSL